MSSLCVCFSLSRHYLLVNIASFVNLKSHFSECSNIMQLCSWFAVLVGIHVGSGERGVAVFGFVWTCVQQRVVLLTNK